MSGYQDVEPEAVSIRLTPLFEARWSYEEFVRVMPFGADSEGQAYAYSTPSRVEGAVRSGSLRITQFPRWRADGINLPDLHGLIETSSGEQVMVHAAGYGIPVSGAAGKLTIKYWMRLWTGASELAWLNSAVAFGIGTFADEEARVQYFIAAPAAEPSDAPIGAPSLELLGTARWEYPEYVAVRLFGDRAGVGFANSVGDVHGEVLNGLWRGWHYPGYLSNGLYQLDAHAEIGGAQAPIISRHAGLATTPKNPPGYLIYDLAQHATFVVAEPGLARLNRTLAVGVGFVRAPGLVRCSYYGLASPTEGLPSGSA